MTGERLYAATDYVSVGENAVFDSESNVILRSDIIKFVGPVSISGNLGAGSEPDSCSGI